ncbi:Zinc finger and SCAN domain-containing protein 29 [Chelonia mydas]|uniref:Zinc finger and SCAN domain-containing protein 29 n=1 Tax=Chelonia mydas TaxID=8469 RepID=M7B8Z3_CHEMY|nr:Zinc finger and SCAN domain-containing protein 29 [Chelonia mydas]
MPSPRTPAWSTQEVVELLGLWGEEAMQAQLRSSCRSVQIYVQIAWGLEEKCYTRGTQLCHVKIKMLQKAKEANSHSGAAPQICPFYKELDAILRGDSPPPPKSSVDTSEESESLASTGGEEWETGEQEIHCPGEPGAAP